MSSVTVAEQVQSLLNSQGYQNSNLQAKITVAEGTLYKLVDIAEHSQDYKEQEFNRDDPSTYPTNDLKQAAYKLMDERNRLKLLAGENYDSMYEVTDAYLESDDFDPTEAIFNQAPLQIDVNEEERARRQIEQQLLQQQEQIRLQGINRRVNGNDNENAKENEDNNNDQGGDENQNRNRNPIPNAVVLRDYVWSDYVFGRKQLVDQPDFKQVIISTQANIYRKFYNTKYPALSYVHIVRSIEINIGFRGAMEIMAITANGAVTLSGAGGNKEAYRQEKIHVINHADRTKYDELSLNDILSRSGTYHFYNSALEARKTKSLEALSPSRIMTVLSSIYFGMTLQLGLWNNEQFNVGLISQSCTTFIASAHAGAATRLCNLLHARDFTKVLFDSKVNQKDTPAYNLISLAWKTGVDAILPKVAVFPEVYVMLLLIEIYATIWLIRHENELNTAVTTLNQLAVLQTGLFYDWINFPANDISNGTILMKNVSIDLIKSNYSKISKHFKFPRNVVNNVLVIRGDDWVPDVDDRKEIELCSIQQLVMDVLLQYPIINDNDPASQYLTRDGRSQRHLSLLVSEAFRGFLAAAGRSVEGFRVIESSNDDISRLERESDQLVQNV